MLRLIRVSVLCPNHEVHSVLMNNQSRQIARMEAFLKSFIRGLGPAAPGDVALKSSTAVSTIFPSASTPRPFMLTTIQCPIRRVSPGQL